LYPPATSAWPSVSSVAVASMRATFMLPVPVHAPRRWSPWANGAGSGPC
jgi:hypothetical protein